MRNAASVATAAFLALSFSPGFAAAAEASTARLDLTQTWVGYASVAVFVLFYGNGLDDQPESFHFVGAPCLI